MSDIKKIKDEYFLKLGEDLDVNQINQIKTDLFGKNGLDLFVSSDLFNFYFLV